jgi:hypothetical protein
VTITIVHAIDRRTQDHLCGQVAGLGTDARKPAMEITCPLCRFAMEPHCEETDVKVSTCAHCRGDDPSIKAGEPLRGDVPVGVAVWPIKEPRATYVPRPAEAQTDDPRVKVTRDLRQIRLMAALLSERGEDLGGDSEMPGGDATATAAPVAMPSSWERRVELNEADWLRKLGTQAVVLAHETMVAKTSDGRPTPEVDDWEPPLQTLLYWSEIWRWQLDMMHEQWLPTLASEANFLASGDVLDWAWANAASVIEVFAADVADARTRLENIVRDGVRTTRSRILCDKTHPDKPHKRLNVLYGDSDAAAGYIAPCCHARYTPDEAKRAHARQMRQAGAEKWITTVEATGALAVQGWQRRTVWRWIEPLRPVDRCDDCKRTWPAQEYPACPNQRWINGHEVVCGGFLTTVWRGNRDEVIEAYCDLKTRRTYVWWPSLWRRHLIAKSSRDRRVDTA